MMRCILTLILVLGTSLAGAGGFLKQSTSSVIKMGPFVDAEDGVTPETGLTISQADIRISKAGGDFAQSNDATGATHDELGYYDVPLDATDTNTVGRLKIAVHEAGALPVWDEYTVLPAAVYDSLIGGSDYLPVDAVQVEGGDATDALAAGAGAALTSYDPPTYAELEARTLPAADYFDPSADGVNVTEVAGSAVASVDDFKADVSSLATVGDFVDAVEDEGTKLHDLWSMTEDVDGTRVFTSGVAEAVWDAVLGDNAGDTASAWLRRVKAAVYDSIQVTGTGSVRTLTLSDGTVQVVSGMARVTTEPDDE